jgi:hypothetical protein
MNSIRASARSSRSRALSAGSSVLENYSVAPLCIIDA